MGFDLAGPRQLPRLLDRSGALVPNRGGTKSARTGAAPTGILVRMPKKDQSPEAQSPRPSAYRGRDEPMNPVRFVVRAEDHPVTITFERQRAEYTVPAGDAVVVELDLWISSHPSKFVIVHHPDGITFDSSGAPATVWKNGRQRQLSKARRPSLYEPRDDA